MTPPTDQQVLKTRDDPSPILFQPTEDENSTESFRLAADVSCSWRKPNETFGTNTLRQRIEPWLTALVQTEHLSLLVGSGLTHAVHTMAVGKGATGMPPISFAVHTEAIDTEAERVASQAGRNKGNFEDCIRAANDLLRGLEILSLTAPEDDPVRQDATGLRDNISEVLESFASSIVETERTLLDANDEERNEAIHYLVSFLMSFASRSGTRDRLNLFTTNYDRYLEVGADEAGLRLVDRFVGTLAPIFRASRLDVDLHYNPPGIRGEPRYLEGVARFTKLHGSVDWMDLNGVIQRIGLPFGAANTPHFIANADPVGAESRRLMIYPNAAKDRETSGYPYVELFRDFAASICRPNSTLVCYGYGFGDEHINRVVEDMLSIPSTHLVVISYGDRLGRIMDTYARLGRHAQITLLVGSHLGDLGTLVRHYLPKPAIDRTTIRMANLLKARWDAEPRPVEASDSVSHGEHASEP